MNNNQKPLYVSVSAMTVIKIILVCIMFYFLYIVKDVLAILFIALIFSSAFDPWVDWMQKRKIPRSAGILIIYIVAFLLLGTSISLIIPPIIEQVSELSVKFPQISENLNAGIDLIKGYSNSEGLLAGLTQAKDNYPQFIGAIQSAFSQITGLFGGLVTFMLVLVLTFYMTVEKNAMKKLIWSVAPERHQVYVMNLVNRMQIKIGHWMRGQIIISFTIFLLVYIALLILGVKYALILALLAGVTEFVPYLGPLIAAVPAVIITFTQSGPTLAIFTAIVYYLIQLTETNIIVPKLMQKVVGLNPIICIAAFLVGFNLAGIIGAVLAIPVTTAANVFVNDFFEGKTEGEGKGEVGE